MSRATPAQLRIDGELAYFEGDLTLAQASTMLAQGKQAIERGVTGFDLSHVRQMDSSAISLLLGLRRFAQGRGQAMELRAVPDGLRSLATLYGVAEHL